MPGFVGHTLANSLVLVGASAWMSQHGWPTKDLIAVDIGIVAATLALSPDMDLFTSRPMEDWGPLRYFWWPYARLVKHRDRLHTPILGTTVRWSYVLILALLALIGIEFLLALLRLPVRFSLGSADETIRGLGYLWLVFVGANIADGVHFFLDVSTHGLKHGPARHYHHQYATFAQRRR